MTLGNKLLPLLFLFSSCHSADHFQETLLGAVGGGNYSYYWLPQPGTVLLHLRSISGDADLYVSTRNLKPTFDLDGHEYQSTTCGNEFIKVASGTERPVSIAVYGHPSNEISLYELKVDVYEAVQEDVVRQDTYDEIHTKNTYDDMHAKDSKTQYFGKPTGPVPNLPVKEEEESSIFWTLLLHILQVLLDLLVD